MQKNPNFAAFFWKFMAKIGIYGGSFNPVHFGHIGLVKWVLAHSDLDQIWMLVSPKSPHKTERADLDANYDARFENAKEAMKDVPNVVVSDFERNLPLPSYTANTLRELAKQFPQHEFSLIIGQDNWNVFDKWREWEYILANYRIFVYPRRGDNICPNVERTKNVYFLEDAPYFDISSTEIRNHKSQMTNDK